MKGVEFDILVGKNTADAALSATRGELKKTDKVLGSTARRFDNYDSSVRKVSGAVQGSNRTMMNQYRNYSLMPPMIHKLNGAMIELSITMASFAIAASPFYFLTKTALKFNSELENTRIGIASVITMSADVVDAQGEQVSGVEAFSFAQKEAIRMQDKLRSDALTTAATFSQLAEAYQQAVGPGLAAGMNLDEIEKITLRVAQSAKAIGVPMNQLNEEIRALLSGNISRDSRLAYLMGLRQEDIDKAINSAEGLFVFLDDKMASFAFAEKAAAMTFDALWANTIGGAEMAIGKGLEPFTDHIRTMLIATQKAILEFDELGNVKGVNPEFVKSMKQVAESLINISDAILFVVKTAATAYKSVGFVGLAAGILVITKGLDKASLSFGKLDDQIKRIPSSYSALVSDGGVRGGLKRMQVPTKALSSWDTLGMKMKLLLPTMATMALQMAAIWGASKAFEAGSILFDAVSTKMKTASKDAENLDVLWKKVTRSYRDLRNLGYSREEVKAAKGNYDAMMQMVIKLNAARRKANPLPDNKVKDGGLKVQGRDKGLTDAQKKQLASFEVFRQKMADKANLSFLSGAVKEKKQADLAFEAAKKDAARRLGLEIKNGEDKIVAKANYDALLISLETIRDNRIAAIDKAGAEKLLLQRKSSNEALRKIMEDAETSMINTTENGVALKVREEDNLHKITMDAIERRMLDKDIAMLNEADRLKAFNAMVEAETQRHEDAKNTIKTDAMTEFHANSSALNSQFNSMANSERLTNLDTLYSDMKKYNDSLIGLETQTASSKWSIASSSMAMLASMASTSNKKQFEAGKKLAKASIIIDTSMGVMKAYRDQNYWMAAMIAAAGAVNLTKVNSTTYDSGGSIPTAPPTAPATDTAGGGGTTQTATLGGSLDININVTGDASQTDLAILGEQIAPYIESALADGFGGASTV